MLKLAVAALLVAYSSAVLYEDYIAEYLGDQGSWEGRIYEPWRGMEMETLRKHLLGTRMDGPQTRNPRMKPAHLYEEEITEGIPYSGTWQCSQNPAWANCKATFAVIKDQAACGSCWAVSASTVAGERECIANAASVKPGQKVDMAAEDIMSCCNWCGDGCEGGYPIDAMRFIQYNGVCTGGAYGSNCGCQTYQIPPCGPQGCNGPLAQTPPCRSSCRSGYQFGTVKQDDHYANDNYMLENNCQKLQQELYNRGPVECAFTVHSSFFAYHGGVYTHCDGPVDGGHAVTLEGWGTEGGVDYWLVKNSWNVSWGLKGYFKIKRCVNLCGFEEQCVACIMKGGQNSFTQTCS